MRWQTVAGWSLQKRRARGGIASERLGEIESRIKERDGDGAFRLAAKTIADGCGDPSSLMGWNRHLRGDGVYGWYGSVATFLPLRALAVELEADEGLCVRVVEYLTALWQEQMPSPDETEATEWLQMQGFDVSDGRLDAAGVKFLQRVNLDARDRPFIERASWSEDAGTLELSDGYRFQVKRAAVWAQSCEYARDGRGGFDEVTRKALRSLGEDARSLWIETPALDRIAAILQFYGMGRRVGNALELEVEAGEFSAVGVD